MSHYEYFLIFLALAFCGYASYTDIKTQKIRNFCSLGLLYAGVLSQLMAWYLGTTTPFYILGLFFGSGLIAFGLYWFGVFSPGDSKLFWGLCLMFPLSLFRNLSGALSFPPLVLALNIIVPYAIGILGYLLFKFVLMGNKLDILRYFFKSNFQKATLFEKLLSLLLFIGIGSGLTYLLKLFEWEPDRFLHLVLVLVAFTLIQKLLSPLPKTPVYYAVIGFVCIWLAVQAAPSVPVFLSSFAFLLGLYLVVFVVAKQLILSLAGVTLDNAVDVTRLQVGMIPAEQIVRVEQPDGTVRYEKQQVGFSSGQGDNVVISPDPEGLTTEEIAQLQYLAAHGAFAEFGNQINVQPSIRFAPVISVGCYADSSLPGSLLSHTGTVILVLHTKGAQINKLRFDLFYFYETSDLCFNSLDSRGNLTPFLRTMGGIPKTEPDTRSQTTRTSRSWGSDWRRFCRNSRAVSLRLSSSYIPVVPKAIWNRVDAIKSSRVGCRGALTL